MPSSPKTSTQPPWRWGRGKGEAGVPGRRPRRTLAAPSSPRQQLPSSSRSPCCCPPAVAHSPSGRQPRRKPMTADGPPSSASCPANEPVRRCRSGSRRSTTASRPVVWSSGDCARSAAGPPTSSSMPARRSWRPPSSPDSRSRRCGSTVMGASSRRGWPPPACSHTAAPGSSRAGTSCSCSRTACASMASRASSPRSKGPCR